MPPTNGKARKARKHKHDVDLKILKVPVRVSDALRPKVRHATGTASRLNVPLDVKKPKLSPKGHASRQRQIVSPIVLSDEESLRESRKCAKTKVESVIGLKGSKDAPIELDIDPAPRDRIDLTFSEDEAAPHASAKPIKETNEPTSPRTEQGDDGEMESSDMSVRRK